MKMARSALLSVLILCSSDALAQVQGPAGAHHGCPQGYTPTGGAGAGWMGCAPIYDPSMPIGSTPPAPPDPGPRWEFRWGVIVVDSERGKFAGMDGYADPRKATRNAIKQCKKNGGKRCKVLVEYHNQCGVLVAGDAFTVAFYGPVIEEASKRAMAQCSSKTPNCQVYYAGCSYPVEKEY
jgi:hypothetical protein